MAWSYFILCLSRVNSSHFAACLNSLFRVVFYKVFWTYIVEYIEKSGR
jgi:hypothetical protein